MHTGSAELPLHGGKAPRWLFRRMARMSGAIAEMIVEEYGTGEFLRRISDPYWFQSLSCVIGFDWHSSGTTTVTMGALKEAFQRKELGLKVAGGKGRASRKTPYELRTIANSFELDAEQLVHASRMSAKVDSAALQDGHSIYHHTMLVDEKGRWAVVQQGLMEERGYARRYHWLHGVKSFSEEPRTSMKGVDIGEALDMSAEGSRDARKTSLDLINDGPEHLMDDISSISPQRTLFNFDRRVAKARHLTMPKRVDWTALKMAYEFQPGNYDELLGIKGIGPATVKALALVSELIYGDSPSWQDPVKYSFAVGGKDGVPYPVNRKAMDEATQFMEDVIDNARMGEDDRKGAMRRLKEVIPA
jgi:hypothetical protein